MDVQNEQKEQAEQVQLDKKFKARPLGLTHKTFILIGLVLVLVLGTVTGGYFLGVKKQEPKACSMEAKICSDGSAVGRTGPNCEFSPCPTTPTPTSSSTDQTSSWKTYVNEKYGFSLKYPSNFLISETFDPNGDIDTVTISNFKKTDFSSGKKDPDNVDVFLLFISVKKNEKGLNEAISWYKNNKIEDFTLNGIIGARILNQDNTGGWPIIVVYNKNEYNFNLRPINSKFANYFDQILSTFTFAPLSASKSTDQDEINQIDNWSIYSNDKFNFKYPSEYFVSISNQRNNFFQLFPKKMISKVDYIDIEYKENADYNKTVNSIKNKLDNVKTEKLKNGISVSGEFKKDLFYSALYNTAAVLINRGDLIVVETPQPKPEFFDQMISTFKFTE